MLGNMISLFKARKDPALAKQIASEMVVDGVIERAGWPVLVTKFWMAVVIFASALFAMLFLWAGIAGHWALALPAIIFGGLAYLVGRIWRGLNRGVETVSTLAKTELTKRTAGLGQLGTPQKPAPSNDSQT
jgi:cation transport ATPase